MKTIRSDERGKLRLARMKEGKECRKRERRRRRRRRTRKPNLEREGCGLDEGRGRGRRLSVSSIRDRGDVNRVTVEMK